MLISSKDAAAYLSIQSNCTIHAYIGLNLTALYDPTQYNRIYQYNVTSAIVVNSSSTATVVPFISSINCIANPNYNNYNITSAFYSGTNIIYIKVFLNYSIVSQVCVTLITYYNTLAAIKNQFINVSYGLGLSLNSASPSLTLASVSQLNFSINAIYGPLFAPKCVVGFQAFSLGISSRQTLSFNLTGTGVFSLMSSSNYLLNYNWLCVADIKCPSSLYQYYPSINDCEPACTILNCSVCSTSTSCLTCAPSFYLNSLYRCSSCLSNCLTCTNITYCQLCISGNYFNPTTGICTACSPYCLDCTISYCNNCTYGYFISGSSCLSCSMIPKCLHCTNSISCSVCPN